MAKLSARGRKEVFRVSKEIEVTDPESSITWEKMTRALMTDGSLLVKRQVRFKATECSASYVHTWGWKKTKLKLKADGDADRVLAAWLAKGWTQEKTRT